MPEYRDYLTRTTRVHIVFAVIVDVLADDEHQSRRAALCGDGGHDYCDESAGRRHILSVEKTASAESPAADC